MINTLIDCGIVQFGRFETSDGFAPYLLNFHLLAAYPDVLQKIGAAVSELITEADRLLCNADSLSLGIATSLHTGIPLVYSRGKNETAAHDLVGAYDVGHPTALITNTLDTSLLKLLKNARSVGLEVNQVIAIMEIQPVVIEELDLHSLYKLPEIVDALIEQGALAPGQGETVKTWLLK